MMQAQNKKGGHRCLKISLCGFMMIVLAVGIWLGHGKYEYLKERKKVCIFIGQIINSVLNNTEFYEKNSDEDAVRNIKNCRNIISDDYTVSIVDYTWGTHEARILFSDKISVNVDISFRNNKPFLSNFSQTPPRWKGKFTLTPEEKNYIAKLTERNLDGVINPKPVLVFALMRSMEENNDIYLIVYGVDEDNDILGIGIREEYYDSDGESQIIEETYPVFTHTSFSGIYSRHFKISIRNKNRSKNENLWQDYVDNKLDKIPPIIVSVPEVNKCDVRIWVYDRVGNKSELVKVKNLIETTQK